MWWHWFFFAQPDKTEKAILIDPDARYGGDPSRWARRTTLTTAGPSMFRSPIKKMECDAARYRAYVADHG